MKGKKQVTMKRMIWEQVLKVQKKDESVTESGVLNKQDRESRMKRRGNDFQKMF